MKRLLLFLALGLAAADKLDRTYLPPPGSKYAGGDAGDLQVPLEFPKETYTTAAPELNKGAVTIGDTRLVPGSARGPGSEYPGPSKDIVPVLPTSKYPFDYYQTSYKLPTTTTSYAFTQTTTFPPTDAFENTPSPVVPGFPIDGSLDKQPGIVNQPFSQGQFFNQQTGPIRPGFVQPGIDISQRPGLLPIPGQNVPGAQIPFPGQTIDGHPGHTQTQNINQYQQGFPVSTVSPVVGSSFQPGLATSSPFDQGYTQHLGVQPPRQFNQQGFIPSSTSTPGYLHDFPTQYSDNVSNIQGTKITGQQSSIFPTKGPQQGTTQYIDKHENFQSTVPGITLPQQVSSQGPPLYPSHTQYGGDLNSILGTSGLTSQEGKQFPQTFRPKGSLPSTVSPQGTTATGFITSQLQETGRPPYSGQQNVYQLPPQEGTQSQNSGEKKPYLVGQSNERPQYVSEQSTQVTGEQGSTYPTTTGPQGPGFISSNQLVSKPEFIGQQNTFQSTLGPQGTLSSAQDIYQKQGFQQPQIVGQQNLYPTTIVPQGTGVIASNEESRQPQYIGQQSPFPTTFTPQGTTNSGQAINQKPASNQLQVIGQQNSFPSGGTPQEFTTTVSTNSQLGGQQPQFNQQSISQSETSNALPSTTQPGFYQQGVNVPSSISPGSNALPGPDQKQFIGPQPGTQQGFTPFTDGRTPSQQSVTSKPGGQNVLTGSPQNVYRPGITGSFPSVPSSYQQPSSSITTPSSIPSYGITSNSVYPSFIPSYTGTDSGAKPSINIRPHPERPQANADRNAVILNYENVLTPDGYAYSFDTSNGIHADENGTTINGVKANGSYSYIGDDGKLYSVVYTADENGFQPYGDHLPTPPPVPKAIQRVIEQAVRDKAAGISHDGFYDEDKYGHNKYQGPKHRRPGVQDKIVNGADIPDDYRNSDDKEVSKKKLRTKGERKPGTSTHDEQALEEYDDTQYDGYGGTHKTDENRNKDHSDRKNISGRTTTKKPGQHDYKKKQDNDLYNKNEETQRQILEQRRPFSQGQESSRRRPSSFDHKDKPKGSRDQYDDAKNYDDKEESEGLDKEPNQVTYDKDRNIPSKTTENEYSIYEEGSRRMNLPARYDPKQHYGIRKPPVTRRPGTTSTQLKENPYDIKETVGKDNLPENPFKNISKTFGTKYYVTDDGLEYQEDAQEPILQNEEEQSIIGRPKGIKNKGHTVYGQSDSRPPGTELQKSNFDNFGYIKGSKFHQKGRPLYDQQTKVPDSSIPIQFEREDTGYQYNPPQNRLDRVESNKFPSRFSAKATTMKSPVTKFNISDQKSTIKPFITPNVHRDEDESYEEDSQENSSPNIHGNLSRNEDIPGTTSEYEYETTEEFFDKQTEPADDDFITSDKIHPARPAKMGAIPRPGYQPQLTTGKPENYDEYTSDIEDKIPQQGYKRPGHENDRYLSDSDKPTEQKIPGHEYSTIAKSRKPGSTYVSSTTPMSFTKSYLPGSRRTSQQQKDQFQYPTTYEPSDTSSAEEDYSEETTRPRPSTPKSTYRQPVTKPGDIVDTSVTVAEDKPGLTKPSSRPTSRPSYDYSDETMIPGSPTIRPGITESTSGRPSTSPVISKMTSYSMVTPGYKPGYGRPEATTPGQPQQDLPSTYRPNYSITDISQPGSVAVDAYGRPVSGTRRPDIQPGIFETTRPGLGPDRETPPSGQTSSVYQDSRVISPERPSSQTDRFKPSEPRFGTVPGIAGPKPAEFGPSSVATPGYLSPYGRPTEKVIGEDFSGPKQPQKFDPETGYYY